MRIKLIEENFDYMCDEEPKELNDCNLAKLDIEDLYDDIKVVDNNFKEVDVFKFNKK